MFRLKGILGVRKSALIRPQHVGASTATIGSNFIRAVRKI